MAKCKNCKHLKYKDDGRERYAWCPFIGDNPDLEFERYCGAFKKMTNADRIRNMTDEELAEFIHKTIFDQGSNLFTCEEPPVNCHEECKECYMDWLQKEVE